MATIIKHFHNNSSDELLKELIEKQDEIISKQKEIISSLEKQLLLSELIIENLEKQIK